MVGFIAIINYVHYQFFNFTKQSLQGVEKLLLFVIEKLVNLPRVYTLAVVINKPD